MVASHEVSPFIFLTSLAAVAVVLVVNSDIDGFRRLSFGGDWGSNQGRRGGMPGVSTRATNAPCNSMGPKEVIY